MNTHPCTVKQAISLVKQWHRHLPVAPGGLFAVALADAGTICAVAIAANPARVWQGTGRVVISRVAVAPGLDIQANACSRLYGALCRAAEALGYREAWTYTLESEPGTSLRAAGFSDEGMSAGGQHGRAGRPRAPAVQSGPKRRWCRKLNPR